MWIRSQDKHKLLNVKAIQVIGKIIEGITAGGEGWTLGEYKTEVRAIGVLNQIQERLSVEHRSDVIMGATRVYRENVFEMPEE